jgi:N-glycosylase/DNA lyase
VNKVARRPQWSVSGAEPLGPGSVVEVSSGDGTPLVAFPWGRSDGFGTAAYWACQAGDPTYAVALGRGAPLIEELCFCLLGGYGVTAETNAAAFSALSEAGLVRTKPPPLAAEVEAALSVPLAVRGHRRPVRYRFPRQRAARVASALARLGVASLPRSPVELRDSLLSFDGVGPKTASWVVRNHLLSDEVAIVDVHLRRAGIAAGFFRPEWRLPQDYHLFEAAFLAYAAVGGVPAGVLDLCIWDQVRRLGRSAGVLLPASRRD